MADYIDSEAEESDGGGEVEDEDDDDDRIGVVRKPKSRVKVKRRDDEDEEEEDDDEMLAEEMKDLIDDNEVEEESDDDSVIGKRKRREEEEDELDDRLEDDDYDLIEENLGVKVQRKKFRRLQQLEDDESDEDENRDNGISADDREVIANELFEGEDEEGARSLHSRLREADDDGIAPEMPSEGEEEEYSDPDDFIVDDDGRPLTKSRRRRPRFTDASLQQAQDIFGVDIDFNDFDAYGDDEEVDDDLDYEEELEAARRKTKKPPRKKTTRKSIFEVYEPSELERGHFTDKDNEIRVNDIPERFQLRGIPVTPVEDGELLEEAEWIYKYAFNTPTVSNQEEDVKAALAEHAAGKVDKWAELKNLMGGGAAAAGAAAPATVPSGEDWDNEIAEDWDADCKTGSSAPPKVPGEEDWDAEIASDAASVAPPVVAAAKLFKDNIPCGEDWDDEIESSTAVKTPAVVTKSVNDDIPTTEDWDDDPAPAPTTAAKEKAWDDMIGGDEDWDAEETRGAASKVASTQPPVKKGPSPAEIAANAEADKKRITMVKKIKEVLNFMRNHHFEVPFIAFYRKEYVEPELNINDLWRIYAWDEKWCQLSIRKANLLRLFQKMQQFQCDEIMSDPDKPLPDDLRILADEDFDRLRAIQTFEELKDAYSHFVLYYGQDISKMQEALRRKALEERRERRARRNKTGSGDDGLNADGEEVEEDPDRDDEDEIPLAEEKIKQATRVDAYTFCRRAGLASLAKKFGLTPLQFGENLRDNYQRNEVEQYPMKPLEVAQEYVCRNFPTADDVLKGARYMVAAQLAREPLVRQCVREMFFERAKINIGSTKKGVKEIDESHPCYPMKYLRNKPAKDLKDAAFLKLVMAEDDGLLTVNVGMDLEGKGLTGVTLLYADEIKQLYHRDEFSDVVQEWNKQRALVLEQALSKFLYPVLQKELRQRLLQESREHITKASCRKLYNWLKMAPYTPEVPMDDDEDFDTANGLRVLAIAYVPEWDTAAFGALIDGEGEMTDFIRLPHLLKRKNAWKESDRIAKEADIENLRKFVLDKKPHVVGVGGESREALFVIDDVKALITELVDSDQIPQIGVELIDNELAKVYMNSTKAEADFREYPPLLKQAISLARRLQDSLVEFSQLCNPDEEIMCLRYHPLQDQVPKDDLINALQLEFVNRTNEVGVDVNRAIANPHTANLVQFVCGLGPRKGQALLKILKQTNSRLENRTNLVMAYHMGPKVFINCAGFIKIDTNSMGDSTDAYVEVLDGSRVHPETYDWARKMAVDALEYDDMAEDANPAGALEEILENPEKLKDLDLDAFAEELERQGFGNRSITLYDIRAELNHRYKDLRARYRPSTSEERFNMLTKETPDTFYVGKLVLCRAVGIARRKPQGEQLDQANPVRNDDTGLWQCPFCLKNDFLEVSEVWNHFDAGSCPGQATGVRARLDNGLFGFIPTKFISDKHVTSPEERVQVGMTIHCRVVKIDIERLQADLTCRSSDLADKNHDWRPTRDVYYDAEADERDWKTDEDAKKRQARQAYIKRVIVHPSFHNISFKEAEKLLDSMDQGDVVVRPSSKGSDHLTVTWKVADGIYQHIDVREEGKENAFSLGQSLWIVDEEFEDLDEIIARYVQPMAAHVRDLLAFRYYKDTGGGKREAMDKLLMEEKRKAPSKIHYLMSASKEYPGKFVLSYLPRNKCRHEYVTASSEGLRYRQQMFHSVNHLIRWFKEHFRDPIPGTPASQTGRTPSGGERGHANNPYRHGVASATATPSINLSTVDPQAIQRAAKNMPHQLFNTLTQVASQTPVAGHATPYANRFGGFQQPYTPSQPMATPMMTPSYHHHHHHPPPHPPPPHHPMATPSHHGMVTPRYHQTATPVHWHHSNQTPSGRTPTMSSGSRNQPVNQKPRQHKSSTNSAPKGPGGSSGSSTTDWKKAAELWAKKQQQNQHGGGGGGQTPMAVEPSGDATPLIDEWPA